jgi:hypothetical protein
LRRTGSERTIWLGSAPMCKRLDDCGTVDRLVCDLAEGVGVDDEQFQVRSVDRAGVAVVGTKGALSPWGRPGQPQGAALGVRP